MTVKAPFFDANALLRQVKEVLCDTESPQEPLVKLCPLLVQYLHAHSVSIWYFDTHQIPQCLSIDAVCTPHEAAFMQYVKETVGVAYQTPLLPSGTSLEADSGTFAMQLPSPPSFFPHQLWVTIPIVYEKKVLGGMLGSFPPDSLITAENYQVFCQLLGRMAGEHLHLFTQHKPHALVQTPPPSKMMKREGIALNKGFGAGPVVLHQRQQMQTDAAKPIHAAAELAAFQTALDKMQLDLKKLVHIAAGQGNAENLEILEAFEMIASDDTWRAAAAALITGGMTAVTATQRVFWDLEKKFRRSESQVLKDRTADLQDISGRMIAHLTGHALTVPTKQPFILVAKCLGPGELMGYAQYPLQGLILEEGLSTSHVSILAKNMRIPIITGVKNITPLLQEGDILLIDGYKGEITIRPSATIFKEYMARKSSFYAQEQSLREVIHQPPITKDGIRISLNINAGLAEDLDAMIENCADGVGLYRTEVSFMMQHKWPMVDEQTALYRRVLDHAQGKPVTFRTLDIGADKPLPYLTRAPEHNPMMGWRAIRMGLDRPGLLRQQIRAILRACAPKNARIMLPMVAEVSEFLAVRELLDLEIARAVRTGQLLPNKIELGVMLEIPALSWQLSSLLPQVDFVSIGSNDLFQFFFASDRTNEDVASRYDVLSPAFLNFIAYIVSQCQEHQVPVAVCGEMAGEPIEALALIGIGVTRLSMNAAAINRVKLMVRQLDCAALSRRMTHLLQTSRRSIRQDLVSFGKESSLDFL